MQEEDHKLLIQIFADYIENCLDRSEDTLQIKQTKQLYEKVCNLLDKVVV